ncbi:hypothetical protein [Neolewinella persica]|uniref:hypothetical protein n=1 Tax=Neolewinella persica TaxID=70998 RepID=UPI00037D7B19|nr:hypothetical protein [Neolewinella persica]
MKYPFYLIAPFLLFTTSCEKDSLESCRDGYHLGDQVRLAEGLKLNIVEVNDQYCPCEVVCGFGGNLQVVLQVEGGNRGRDTLWAGSPIPFGDQTVLLGEVFNRPSCGGITPVEEFCFEIIVQ